MTTFAVLGPGGVGGLLAAALSHAGEEVTVVAREPTAETIARDGIAVRSAKLGAFVARPRAVALLSDRVGVLLVATKATSLESALRRITAAPSLVVPLLNGLDHLELLRSRFGADCVAAGVIRVEADRPEPGHVVHTSPSLRVDLAADDPALAARLQALAEVLSAAGIPAVVGAGERQILWSKLVRLNALASTTSVARRPLGAIRSDPSWRAKLLACVEEAAAVANADGARIDPADTIAELDSAHPDLGSSMQRDLEAGREPELDAIQGSVLRAGARHGIGCPTVAELAREIAERSVIRPQRFG